MNNNYLIGPVMIGVETLQQQIERNIYLIYNTKSEERETVNFKNQYNQISTRRNLIKGNKK